MVRQAHHGRLNHPLFPSIKLRTGSELVEGYAPFKTFQINGQSSRFNVQREALLRSDRGWQLGFAETIKGELDSKAMHREVEQFEETHVLREESEVYGFKSAVFWNESFEDART